MKYLIEFVLVLVLISLLYIRPDALYSFYNNILGRLVLIVAVVLLTHQSTLAGLLGVLFVVAISQSVYEGMATKDEVTEENEREELLKNAPSVQSGLFLVPKVIEGET